MWVRKRAPIRPRTEELTFHRAAEGDQDTKIAMCLGRLLVRNGGNIDTCLADNGPVFDVTQLLFEIYFTDWHNSGAEIVRKMFVLTP